MNPINLTGFTYSGPDTVERLIKAFNPLIKHLGRDDRWFRDDVILTGLVSGAEISTVIRGVAKFAQWNGFQVQGLENLRAA